MTTARLEIESVAFGGSGVGAIDGKVCFSPGVLPGEIIDVELVKEKKRHWIARPRKLVRSSPDRIEPACPFARRVENGSLPGAPTCPGCAYQHVDYESELAFKRRQLHEMVARSGVEAWELTTPSPMKSHLHYRNKITLTASQVDGETRLGYFLEDNQTVFDLSECPLAHPAINEMSRSLRRDPGFVHTLRDGMRVTFRHTENDGVTFWRNRPKRNATWLRESTPIGVLSVPVDGFFQVNPEGLASLIDIVRGDVEMMKPKRVVDLFCGVGVFAIAVAKAEGVTAVVGVELDQNSIRAAEYNAGSLGVDGCGFRSGDAAKLAVSALKGPDPTDTLLIVDPPRSGLAKKLRDVIGKSAIRDMVYVSCAPDTMIRDVVDLHRFGWRPVETRLVDMFPRTAHFETVTRLRRGD